MSAPESPTVLVIEDEPDLVEMYEIWLEDCYEVRTAMDGETALERLDRAVDVVVLDRRMPGLSGDEVLERIRSNGYDCRVVIVSAVEPDFDVIEMGFDDYVTKPVSRDALVDGIETLLLRSTYTEEVQEYFSLASKAAVLEANKTREELEASDEYADLRERLAEVQESIDSMREQLSENEDVAAVFRDLDHDFGDEPGEAIQQ